MSPDTVTRLDGGQHLNEKTTPSSAIVIGNESHLAVGFPFLAPPERSDEIGRLGGYRILSVVGTGGMGIVFRAEDPQLKRQVALKAMLPQYGANPVAKGRFLREARAQAAIEHDHVAAIFQVGGDRGVAFIAMPLLKGMSLADALRANPRVPLTEVVRIAREMALGLAGAHEQSLIHRDIKPGNIWLEAKTRRVKILDFGLACASDTDQADGLEHVTKEGRVVGTPAYMSPEQACGELLDGRSDLFSLGIVLYQMLTGSLPFRAPNSTAMLVEVVSSAPASAALARPEIPHALDALTMALLAKRPEDRPASAELVAAELARIEAALHTNSSTGIPLVLPTQTAAHNPWAAIDTVEADSVVAVPVTRDGRRSRRWLPWVLFALIPVLLVVLGVILRVETANGTFVIEIKDKEVEARIKDGKLVLVAPDGKERYTLAINAGNNPIDAGPYKVRVTGADGLVVDTPEFTLMRGGEVTVRVSVDPKTIPSKWTGPNADRKASDYALSIGGGVRVNGEEREIRSAADLPKETFRLTGLNLSSTPFNDAGAINFKDCKNLASLNLNSTKITDAGLVNFKDNRSLVSLTLGMTDISDAGLANFKDCKSLQTLNLWAASRVTDAGMTHFRNCKELQSLVLYGTKVTDIGLANFAGCRGLKELLVFALPITDAALAIFKDCKDLTILNLGATHVTDAGLAIFKDCKNLWELNLYATAVTDAGLAAFKDCKNLTRLSLREARVGDVGLGHFKDCKNLADVRLENTQVSDAGLALLAKFKSLAELKLVKTKVTAAGIAELKKLLPQCKIEWDGGVILASFDDRKGAEYVLSVGGSVRVNDEERIIKAAAELPKEAFRLTGINLPRIPVGDVGLANFKGCQHITILDLNSTNAGDAGLTNFKDCKNLTYLNVEQNPLITDAGLANFKDCKNLQHLAMYGTKVTDAGLANFKDCKNLTYLDLNVVLGVSDAGLANFKGCDKLQAIRLQSTQVTDAGLAIFKNCTKLTSADLPYTRITDTGLAHLKGCTELTNLNLTGVKVTDAGLAHLTEWKNLRRLFLNETQVRGTCLVHLKGCKNLRTLELIQLDVTDEMLTHIKDVKSLVHLDVRRTKVTAAGIEELRKALPQCKIIWDGGTIEPKM